MVFPAFNNNFLSPGMTLSTLRHIRATHNVVMGYFSHVAQCNHFSWLTSESTRHLWHCFFAYINSCNELRNNTMKVTKLWTYWLDLKLTEDIWSWTTLVDISNALTVAWSLYNELQCSPWISAYGLVSWHYQMWIKVSHASDISFSTQQVSRLSFTVISNCPSKVTLCLYYKYLPLD